MKGHAVANVYVVAAKPYRIRKYLPDTAEFSFGDLHLLRDHKERF
jgi:hypothetical protein